MSLTATLQYLKEARFEAAIPLAERSLREAAAESPDCLLEAARALVAWKGFFANHAEAAASEPYFRAVHHVLKELCGPESPAATAAAENLAGILGSLGQLEEAIALRERVLANLTTRFAPDDPRVMQVRDGLGFLYRQAGLEEQRDRLYRQVSVCEHLAPAERYIREQGGKVVACCRPWSANCHIWIYFDALLDCERLLAVLPLDAAVQIHDHRGTHDGSERGLVCTIHHDALMGPHPADAPAGHQRIPAG